MHHYLNQFIVVLLFGIQLNVYGQQTDIKRSNNKVTLNGEQYYIHIVRKGETLFAISDAYNTPVDSIIKYNQQAKDTLKINQYLKIKVLPNEQKKQTQYNYYVVQIGDTPFNLARRFNITIDELYALNPGAEITIKVGETLKIPLNVDTEINTRKIDNPEKQIIDSSSIKGIVKHTAQKKQTVFGIATIYGCSVDDIYKQNPGLQNRQLQVGEIIEVPLKHVDAVENNDYYFHKVEKQETIFRITQKYGIKEKALLKINPVLKDKGLQTGDLIKIPKHNVPDSIINNDLIAIENQQNDIQQPINQTGHKYLLPDTNIQIINECKKNIIDKNKKYKVAIFLPFYLSINDTLGQYIEKTITQPGGYTTTELVPRAVKNDDIIYERSQLFIDFYQGALLALNTLRKQGMNFDVHVFDTQNDSSVINNILQQNNLSNFDLFIGPVYGENLNIVGDYAWEHQINIVSPLSLKSSFIDHNPYAFQVSPPFEVQMKHASDFLNSFDTKNYIVIHDGNNLNQEYISLFKKQLYAQIDETNFNQIKYNEVYYYDARDSILNNIFSPGIENIVIVPSSDQGFVSDVIGKLNGYSYNYKITVFGQPRWLRFDNIELGHFHNTKTHIFSNTFIDYKNPSVSEFVDQYRKWYKTEPELYAFMGYDITKYFLSALNYYGRDFRKCIHLHNIELLQTKFNFVPYTDQGGFQNTAIYILEFTDDYQLQKKASYPN